MHRALASYTPNADDADQVVRRHGAIVDRAARRIALRAANPSLYDDLWSAGALGLIEASRRYDATKGASFETFAEHRVRGAMMDELRRQDHLPRRLRAQAGAVAERRHQLNAQLGREPTTDELAQACQLSVEELGEMETLPEPHLSMEWIAQQALSPDAEDLLGRAQLQRALTAAISDLPERLQMVLGLIYTEDLSYAEVAGLLEISKPRVCQLHADAVARLRAALDLHREDRA